MADATRIVRNLSIERSSSVWTGRVLPAALHALPVPGVLREEFFRVLAFSDEKAVSAFLETL